MKKTKRKFKWRNIILLGITIILIIIFIISLTKIVLNLKDKISNDKLVEEINKQVVIQDIEVKEKEDIEFLNGTVEENINYYYDYLKVPFMDVDFSKLKSINNEVVGWINVVGANVNYPYVKTTNNDYYLYYSFDKTRNDYGWVFLDYRNNKNELDKNNIIYAHGGNPNAMFGPLKKLYDDDTWYNNPDNHYIKISTENYNYVFKVFSLYKIKTTSDYLVIDFEDDDKFQEFLDKIKNRSKYTFETELSASDKIITLSTCYNKTEKLVIHGKLIKQSEK